jgi:hypothetical protein
LRIAGSRRAQFGDSPPRGLFQAAIRQALLRFGNFQDHYDKVQETGESFRKTVVNSRQFADEEKQSL